MKKLLALLLACGITAASAATSPPNTATWTWNASAQNTDGSALLGVPTYNLYIALKGQPKVLAFSGITALTKVTTGHVAGTTVCGEVTAVVVGEDESDHSLEACKTFPKLQPNPPTLLTVAATSFQVQGGKLILVGGIDFKVPCGADAHRKAPSGRELYNVPRNKVRFTRKDNGTQTFGVCA